MNNRLFLEYDPENGGHAIVTQDGGLLYESAALLHLSRKAVRRLAQIHNEQEIDYEGAEAILVAEGLYQPEEEAEL